MAAFATAEDLATFMQQNFTAEETATAVLLLDLVSAAIRSYTGQTISAVDGESVTLEAPCGYHSRLFLPQLPVTAVTSVTVAGTLYTALTDYYVRLDIGTIEFLTHTWWWSSPPSSVVVVYSHGYATGTPELDVVKAVCLEAAAATFGSAGGSSSDVKSESVGNYSVTYGDDDAGSTVAAVAQGRLDRFRVLAVA